MGSEFSVGRLAARVTVFVILASGPSLYGAGQETGSPAAIDGGGRQGTAAKPAKPAPQRPATPPGPAPASNGNERAYLTINGGYQATPNNFSSTWSFDYFVEPGSATGRYPVRPAFLFDIGGGARVWHNLSVGAAVSHYSRGAAASLDASVPHPFFFDRPRAVEGTEPGPKRTETALHLHLRWMLRTVPKMQVALFGGPSVFNTRQVLISTLAFSDTYPYDTVTLDGVTTGTQSRWSAGFNLGADIAYMFTPKIGVGVLIRVARSHVEFQGPDGKPLGVYAGGAQAGGGLRFRFWSPKPPKPGVRKQPPGTPPVKKKGD